jgi:ribosome-associated heat shock protein Hsp15
MDKDGRVRMDQWLAAVRIFKTRSQATEACKKGKILVNDIDAKPSHVVKIGEIVGVKSGPIIRTFLVKGLLHKRVSAKIAMEMMEETTPDDEIEKLRLFRSNYFAFREKGMGRPTKRERRKIDRLKGF